MMGDKRTYYLKATYEDAIQATSLGEATHRFLIQMESDVRTNDLDDIFEIVLESSEPIDEEDDDDVAYDNK